MTKVTKRDCSEVAFDKSKIKNAIMKAMKYGSGRVDENLAGSIAASIESKYIDEHEVSIYEIEKDVFNMLCECMHEDTARAYEGYRSVQTYKREHVNTTDDAILSLVNGMNSELATENSNKDIRINSTQRDYIAGEVSKDLTRRYKLPTRIVQAHDEAILHFHDEDYFLQPMNNCFSGDTMIITKMGTKRFDEFSDGDKVIVPTHTGEWKNAVVKKYGTQAIYNLTFKRNGTQVKNVKATENHRWILHDETSTTNLKVGDKLIQTPVIESYDFNKCSLEEKKYWCLGFALGDGSNVKNTEANYGIKIRLCGSKNRFEQNFIDAGYTVTHPNTFDGDGCVWLPYEDKNKILNNNLSTNQKISLFNGLISADGDFRGKEYPNGIQTSNKTHKEFILNNAELCGFYLNKTHDLTGKSTNYVKNRKPTWRIAFNRRQYHSHWKLISKEYVGIEEVWCLEVEDNHSFILSGGIVTGNCGLVNIKDMFDNGTVINGRAIRKPNSFQVACTVMTQIIAQVASSQYGGTSVAIKHLGEYLKISEDKYRNMLKDVVTDKDEFENTVQTLLMKELQGGIQTIQYQILTLMTTNGQTPFVTLFLELDKKDKYLPYTARVIYELLKQRLDGIPNENGIKSTPTFPKLIYVLDDFNCFEGGEYDWVTDMAVQCSAVRMYPDYISAKEMRKIYEGNVFSSMGCRSFLSPWKDEKGKYKFEGRFNQGVVTLNLPQIGIIANGDMEAFDKLLDNRLELCFEALMCRHKALEGVKSDVAPILWQHGAYGRLKKGEPIDELLHNGYSTISLGYIGLYEVTKLMTGESHTSPKGTEFALALMNRLNNATRKWKAETGLGFGLYGSPAESLCYRFAKIDKKKYGSIKDITDKEYYTNSYHVDVREEIDAFSKLKFESQFQSISTGGCISYIEANTFGNNLTALKQLVNFIYHNIQYAEFNLKCDYCFKCGYNGQMTITNDLDWVCPNCGNTDKSHMEVVRRTCGYLGSNWWNRGKTNEISKRVLHI